MNEFAYFRSRSMGLSSYIAQGSQFVWPFMYYQKYFTASLD